MFPAVVYYQDPDALMDYTIDWGSRWLGTDTIATSEWIVPDGINMNTTSNTPTKATIWLSGGTLGESYDVTNRVTTDGGRIQDQTLRIVIKEQ